MKKLVSLLLAVMMLMTCAAAYTDVPSGAYYEKNLTELTAMGVVYRTGAFNPDSPCTRAQFVTWLHNMAGKPEAKAAGFKDVTILDTCAKAVNWAKETGITTGISETLFGKNDTVTRAQMVTFMHRYATKMAYTNVNETAPISSYADSGDVAQYAQGPMAWAVAIGMVKGNTDNTLTPNAPATRAHAIAFLGRLKDSQPATPAEPVTSVESGKWDVDGDGVLSILSIGNSYSDDANEYIGEVALALGVPKVYTANLYVGSCNLEMHAGFLDTEKQDYDYRVFDGAAGSRAGKADVIDALNSRSWDYVTLQQGSRASFLSETYNEDITKITDFVHQHEPQAKIAWHMTWAYSKEHTTAVYKTYFAQDQMKMYEAICATVRYKIVEPKLFDVLIPVGTAVQNARSSKLGDTLNRDGTHLSMGMGRYIAALTFVKSLTGLSIDNITYTPAPGAAPQSGKDTKYEITAMTAEEKAIAIESVNNAIKTPLAITQSAYTG